MEDSGGDNDVGMGGADDVGGWERRLGLSGGCE